MSRIRKGYEAQYRALLQRLGARRPDQGVAWLIAKAHRLSAAQRLPLAGALTRVYQDLVARLPRRGPPPSPASTAMRGSAAWPAGCALLATRLGGRRASTMVTYCGRPNTSAPSS
ncbi:hypothetical protein SBV1_590014 [Verrucomicrobia bacterium]|nr:hypothetical protein SBV1_590014 [Verrucomicrobiota bacterium]